MILTLLAPIMNGNRKKAALNYILDNVAHYTVADPGFPVGGGRRPVGGAPTSDAYTFRQKCMQKQKKLILLGGRVPAAPSPDPPMLYIQAMDCGRK